MNKHKTKPWIKLEITGMLPVEYNYFDGSLIDERESEIEHIRDMLLDGYLQGELNYYDSKTENEIKGWWRCSK